MSSSSPALVPSAPSRECLGTLQWHSTGLSAWKSPPSPEWLTGVHTLPSIPGVFLNRMFSISEYKHSETERFLTCHFFRISNRYLKINRPINLTTVGYTNKSNFKGIVHPTFWNCRKCAYPQAMHYEDEFVSSSEQIWRNVYITCSPMDPLQWMGAVRMRVQTADKNITIIQKWSTPLQSIS